MNSAAAASAATVKTRSVALLGNPNTGKSTLFTALAGVRQRIGNYPGVTVEKKTGTLVHEEWRLELIDLPGTYSLAPRSPDEMVAVDVLLGRRHEQARPDAVLCIVDASNIERNLYLVNQVLELELPTVVALNMTDLAEVRGLRIDAARLAARLGVAVVPVQANRRKGIADLKAALLAALASPAADRASPFPEAFRRELADLETWLADRTKETNGRLPRYLVERLLLDTSGYLEQSLELGSHLEADGSVEQNRVEQNRAEIRERLIASRRRLADCGCPVPAIEAMARYAWVEEVLEGVVARPTRHVETVSDRIDRVLTHRLWGTLVFVLVMLAVFASIFVVAKTPMAWIDSAMGWLGDVVASRMAPGAFESLLVDGVIGGVGGVLVFLPQILFLFFFIGILEDCGYMARAAYLMDKLMVRVGLSGKSFIPLLSSFACAIPGVMAARVIENRRDRLTTILVAPLMSCSARVPVYMLMTAAFIPEPVWLQVLAIVAMYLLGILAAMAVALVLKRSLLRGPTPPFVLELPSYKWPSPLLVFQRMVERGWSFVQRAGTLILAVSIVVWAATYYPHNVRVVEAPFRAEREALGARLKSLPADDPGRAALEDELTDVENRVAGAYQRQSVLGRIGRFIEPAVKPLGWDWRIGCAVIASFPAREVVVGTLGVIYNVGSDVDEGAGRTRLAAAMQQARWDGSGKKVYNVPVALSLMVFFSLCAQCAATLAVIKRETNSWGWPVFTFAYMTGLAYLAALATYQVGMAFA